MSTGIVGWLLKQLQYDPCVKFGTGFDQPNPFCWLSVNDALVIGTLFLTFSTLAIGVTVSLRRMKWDLPLIIVIAISLAAYAYPSLQQNPEFRTLIAHAALGIAFFIPLVLTYVAIKMEIQSKLGYS